jgi:type IV pilus assembly protein PilC
MAEFLLKYADTRGQIHQQVAHAGSEREVRDRYTQQGFLIYSIKTKGGLSGISVGFSKRKKLNIEKFLIFNQQFVTLIRAGLPILKGARPAGRPAHRSQARPYIKSVRDDVRNGTLLSDAFRMQGIFPKIYVTTVMAGEKSAAWRRSGPLHHLSEALAGGAKKVWSR